MKLIVYFSTDFVIDFFIDFVSNFFIDFFINLLVASYYSISMERSKMPVIFAIASP